MVTNFPDPADLLNFTLTITPDEGMPVWIVSMPFLLTFLSSRNVQRGRFHLFLCDQYELSSWATKGQMHADSMSIRVRLSIDLWNLFVSDISSERGSGGECMPEHSQGRLEARPQSELRNGRITILVFRAKRGWSSEQRWGNHLQMTTFIAERWWQMRPRSYEGIGSSSYTTWSIQCEEAMSRAFNMRTYLLKKAFLVTLVSPRLVLALLLYTFSHQAVFVVIAQGTIHHHSLMIVIMS